MNDLLRDLDSKLFQERESYFKVVELFAVLGLNETKPEFVFEAMNSSNTKNKNNLREGLR